MARKNTCKDDTYQVLSVRNHQLDKTPWQLLASPKPQSRVAMETAVNFTNDRFLSRKNLLPFHLPNNCKKKITKSTDGKGLKLQRINLLDDLFEMKERPTCTAEGDRCLYF